MKKTVIFLMISYLLSTNIYAYTSFSLNSDYYYKFNTLNSDEFYTTNGSGLDYNLNISSYVEELYNLNGVSIYNSKNGINTIGIKNNTEQIYDNAPSTAPIQYSSTGVYHNNHYIGNNYGVNNVFGNGTYINNGVSMNNSNSSYKLQSNISEVQGVLPDEYGNITFPSYSHGMDFVRDLLESDLLKSDGSIGNLNIPSVNIKEEVYTGDINSSMNKGVGHIETTSFFNGNIGIAGHNRGSNPSFSNLKNIDYGDIIKYSTIQGTKEYIVDRILIIDETDWSYLNYSVDDKITLITCVENQRGVRLLVQGTVK